RWGYVGGTLGARMVVPLGKISVIWPLDDRSTGDADRRAFILPIQAAQQAMRTEMPLFVPFPFIPGSNERYNGF
ncbi:hypothetical protein, partial [Paenibacillus sonchi]|uniref:hypothetical protein n=1 Tax=Paenibacillus sonchi TaxID=373687 RepID=UPI001AE02507